MVHVMPVEFSGNQCDLIWFDVYAGFMDSFQHANHILKVFSCLAQGNDFPERGPPICEPVPVQMFEKKCGIAQCDFDWLSFELCLILVAVDELFLFLGEVMRQ